MKKYNFIIWTIALLVFNASGQNVGIGIATPNGKLHISGGYATTGMSAPGNSFYMNANGTSPDAAQIVWGDNTGWKLHFGTVSGGNFLPRVTMQDQGNVGIGITAPTSTLHVNGTITTTGFRLTTAPVSGYVLTSDGTGNGTWQPSNTGIAGTVNSAGSITHGSGFTVTNPSTGVYNVTFSTALPSVSGAVASIVTSYTPSPVYCSANSNCIVGNINVFTFNGVTTINNSGTGCAGGGYSNYTGMSANVNAGGTYTFSMQSDGFWNPEYWAMWVDWNQDGDFNDIGEAVWNSVGDIWNPSGSLIVPVTAVNGSTRLRIRTSNGGIPGTGPYSGSCGNSPSWDYGEVEDYTLVISGGVTPFGIAHVQNLSVSGCSIVTTTTSGTPANMSFSFQVK